jgi:hypothetical protein
LATNLLQAVQLWQHVWQRVACKAALQGSRALHLLQVSKQQEQQQQKRQLRPDTTGYATQDFGSYDW